MPQRKLTVLGDSAAEGRGGIVREDGTYFGFVEHLAQALGIADDVCNLGSFGATTENAAGRQLSVALENPAPIMGVSVGGNDLVHDYDRDRFQRDLRQIYTTLAQPGRLVFTTSWPRIPDRLPGLDEPTRAMLRDRFAEANEFLDKLVWELDLVCLDLANAPLATDPVMWCHDGMHPSPAGHQAIGLAMADLIDESLTHRA